MTLPGVTGRHAGDRLPAVSQPGFVGRDRELAALAQALDGSPAVILVEGEAGIGKTRLIQEYLARPGTSGGGTGRGPAAMTLVTSCPPFRQPHTLGPVTDALRRVRPDVSKLPLTGLAGALRPLSPEWASALPPAPESLQDASAARHRLFAAVDELLECLGTGVVVVEDAHWADEATLEFLLFQASGLTQARSLVITCRPEDVPEQSLLPRLRRHAGLRLTLGPLTVPDVAQLVSSMLAGEQVSDDLAAFLHSRSEGLPLAVEESVRLLAAQAGLAWADGEWVRRGCGAIDVPPTLLDVAHARGARHQPPGAGHRSRSGHARLHRA